MPSFEFLGPYRIGETLGRGGMGSVYSAVHEKTGEPVAVKLIAQHIADEPRFRRRFDFEIKTLQRLRHDGIVRLIGFGEEEGQLFYSMELVEGESLQERIRRERTVDWRATMDVAIQICAALKHAHDIGVIHRDLKPANLILTSDDRVKLVDFGIAKMFGDGEQTVAGSVLGTADYMAPEQAVSSGITHRTDLYALGSLMYAMLTGRAPFTGKKITEVIESLKRDRPVPLDLIKPDLPEALVELVHQLLEKEPADRPPTALAVMNRLKAMRAGLQRELTVIADVSPTEIGPSDRRTSDTHDTGIKIDSDAATGIAEDPTQVKRKRTIVSKGASKSQPRSVNPSDATRVSANSKTLRPDGSVAGDHEANQQNAKTHFQTVGDTQPSDGIFRDTSADPVPNWTQWLTIAGMVAILIVGSGLFIYALRPPTADQLYVTASTGDKGAMKTFIRRFPDDHRYDEVLHMHMASRLTGVLNRLAAQAKVGVTPLEAAEEGFVTAMKGREQEPGQSMARLEQWRNVYDSPDSDLDPVLKELIELAKYEQTQLANRAPKIIVDPRAEGLIDDIRETVASENAERIRTKLTGIIQTFGNDIWAKPAVEEAARQLGLLKNPAVPLQQ